MRVTQSRIISISTHSLSTASISLFLICYLARWPLGAARAGGFHALQEGQAQPNNDTSFRLVNLPISGLSIDLPPNGKTICDRPALSTYVDIGLRGECTQLLTSLQCADIDR